MKKGKAEVRIRTSSVHRTKEGVAKIIMEISYVVDGNRKVSKRKRRV